MKKAIDILSDWVSDQESNLELLHDRRDTQKKWSEVPDKAHYYKPKYGATLLQIERLKRDIAECEDALILLHASAPESTE